MRKPVWIVLAASGSLTLLFAALHAANPDYRSKDHPLGDFHRWTKVNDKPAFLPSYIDELCSASLVQIHQRRIDLHSDTYINVYVNGKGRSAMLSGDALPTGTVIFKEKLASERGPAVMSTVMIKREPGYNPDCGDWEFATMDAAGSTFTSRGKIDNCMSCHTMHKRNDHTFRYYLPGHLEGSEYPSRYVVDSGGWDLYPYMPYDY